MNELFLLRVAALTAAANDATAKHKSTAPVAITDPGSPAALALAAIAIRMVAGATKPARKVAQRILVFVQVRVAYDPPPPLSLSPPCARDISHRPVTGRPGPSLHPPRIRIRVECGPTGEGVA